VFGMTGRSGVEHPDSGAVASEEVANDLPCTRCCGRNNGARLTVSVPSARAIRPKTAMSIQ
jgi:hypothetical protein